MLILHTIYTIQYVAFTRTRTKLNHKNNITKHNFISNVQISYSNRMKLEKSM